MRTPYVVHIPYLSVLQLYTLPCCYRLCFVHFFVSNIQYTNVCIYTLGGTDTCAWYSFPLWRRS